MPSSLGAPLSPSASSHARGLPDEAEISAQVVADLYERSRVAILLLLVLLGVFRWTVASAYAADERVKTLFLFLIAVNGVRWGLSMVPARRRDEFLNRRAQFSLFAGGVAFTSLTLGSILLLAWPQLDTVHIAILSVITSGLVSGAVMSIGFSPLVYMIYMLPPVGALFLRAITDQRPPWGANILATSFAIYAVAVFVISLDQRRMRRQAIQLNLSLSDLVMRDTLTRLHNRRFLQDLMPVESARMSRAATDLEHGRIPTPNTAIVLYMLDLDFFKQVNDSYGHAAGDAVLKQTAAIFESVVRNSDNLVRWGGEEFVAVAWVKHRDHARVVAEKLRKAIESTEFLLPDGQGLHKTVSVGFCVMPFFLDQPRKLTWEQVLALADAALYVAKTEGRNRWIGVASGKIPWPEIPQTYAAVLHDLKEAEDQGLVALERFAPGAKA